jgi:hypothetical protein
VGIERAISIRQPYVEQILRGIKKIEYRSRPTTIRERVFLYASLTPGASPKDWTKVKKAPGELPTGLIVGTVEIVGCRFNAQDGCYHYVLRNPKRLRKPLTPLNQPQPVFWRPRFTRG